MLYNIAEGLLLSRNFLEVFPAPLNHIFLCGFSQGGAGIMRIMKLHVCASLCFGQFSWSAFAVNVD